MFRKVTLSLIVLAISLVAFAPMALADRGGTGGRGDGPVIWVSGQGLFYDSIIAAKPLPWKGPFQELRMDGPGSFGLQTEFGPGDPEYRGGRWWVDSNPNGYQDALDDYFSCPLLGPGRETE